MHKTQQSLSDIVVYNKYARYIDSENRRETWKEIVDRYVMMMVKKYGTKQDLIWYQSSLEAGKKLDYHKPSGLVQDILKNSKYLYDKKVMPSMRAAQFSGPAIEKNHARIYNCCFVPVSHHKAFGEIMFLLLGGTGVGFSVQTKDINELPDIIKPVKERKFLIGDSIENWAGAVTVLMKSYFGITKSKPRFDFSDIRPKGERLITAGGKAPGPEPLKRCLFEIEQILERKENGDKLTSIEVHDIVCHIADCVLAGGIRRAALISLFSVGDSDVKYAKFGSWWEQNAQRGRANNSGVFLRNRVTKDYFKNYWKTIKDSQSGEPGFYFTSDPAYGTNPCAEISLRPYQFCVAGNTKLITRQGIEQIDQVVGEEVEIWNGEEWSKVKPYQTGGADRLHRVYFSDGSYLDVTDDHKFLVKNRFENDFREVTTLELQNELDTSKYGLQIPRANVQYEGGYNQHFAYEYGYVLGDGCVYRNQIYADLYGNGNLIELEGSKHKPQLNYNGTQYTRISFNRQLDVDFTKKLKYEEGLPKKIFTWSRKSILGFIAGWADADGSQASKGIRIYGREDKIRDAQILLTKCGINSSVNLMFPEGFETNLSVRKNAVWYLQITKTIDIPCQRLVCDNAEGAKYKGKYQIVKRIDTLDGLHKSYCLTENKLHQCVFNNVLTKQCNLTEINAGTILKLNNQNLEKARQDFLDRTRVAAFFGTLQAGFTDFHYLRDVWKKNTEKDALIGVGMTGICNGDILILRDKFENILTEGVDIVLKENERVAELIGINPAARTTTVKPSGSTSAVLGTSSGIHAWHSKFYIRNMQTKVGSDLYNYFVENHPELIKVMDLDPTSAVIGIPQQAPDTAILREDETAIEMLERVKMFNLEWVHRGHRKGPNTNNVSSTISLKENEWSEVGEWMWENRNTYNGLSVLPYDGGTYKDAPFQECDESEYEFKLKFLDDIDLTNIVEQVDNTNLTGEIACAGGACDI